MGASVSSSRISGWFRDASSLSLLKRLCLDTVIVLAIWELTEELSPRRQKPTQRRTDARFDLESQQWRLVLLGRTAYQGALDGDWKDD